jgi:hypothetical protein
MIVSFMQTRESWSEGSKIKEEILLYYSIGSIPFSLNRLRRRSEMDFRDKYNCTVINVSASQIDEGLLDKRSMEALGMIEL